MSFSAFARRTVAPAALVIVLLLAFAAGCLAASFSADLAIKNNKMSQTGKTYVDGKKSRIEMSAGPMQSILIVRGDKGVTWMLNPAQKQFMESRAGSNEWNDPNWQKNLERQATKKHLGKAKIAGYVCDKYLYTFKNKEMGTSTICVAQKLGYPIRVESKSKYGGMTMELKNIKEGRQAASLFEIPKGYKKTDMPGLPPMGGKPKPPAKPN